MNPMNTRPTTATVDALRTARVRLRDEAAAMAATTPGGFDHRVAQREHAYYAALVQTLEAKLNAREDAR